MGRSSCDPSHVRVGEARASRAWNEALGFRSRSVGSAEHEQVPGREARVLRGIDHPDTRKPRPSSSFDVVERVGAYHEAGQCNGVARKALGPAGNASRRLCAARRAAFGFGGDDGSMVGRRRSTGSRGCRRMLQRSRLRHRRPCSGRRGIRCGGRGGTPSPCVGCHDHQADCECKHGDGEHPHLWSELEPVLALRRGRAGPRLLVEVLDGLVPLLRHRFAPTAAENRTAAVLPPAVCMVRSPADAALDDRGAPLQGEATIRARPPGDPG